MRKTGIFIMMCAAMLLFTPGAFSAEEIIDQPEKKETPADKKDSQSDKKDSKAEKEESDLKEAWKIPLRLMAFHPNYIMPGFYTFKPYNSVYRNYTLPGLSAYFNLIPNAKVFKYNTSDGKTLLPWECKFQVSLLIPLKLDVILKDLSINFGYTQVSFWQFYKKDAYFRETNYEPEVFLHYKIFEHVAFAIGATHQSNGRGGSLERSWNRADAHVILRWDHWHVDLKGWFPIFKKESIDLHNPDLLKYTGYGRLLVAYNVGRFEFSAQGNNFFESRFRRWAFELTASFRIFQYLSLYVSYFNGYAQSLIEYNHKCQSFGAGLTANGWFWDI
jgi:phospholipase A1/A2